MTLLYWLTVIAYAGAGLAYIFAIARRAQQSAESPAASTDARPRCVFGQWSLLIALGLHVGLIGQLCMRGLSPVHDSGGVLNLIGLVLAVATLLAVWRWPRLGIVGALSVPLITVVVISSALFRRSSDPVAASGVPLLGKIHLILVALGVAAFALAALVSLLYLLQESALRRRRGGMAGRVLPPLATLDGLAHRITLIGFPIFSLAVAAGVLWTIELRPAITEWRIEYTIAAGIWLAFATILVARSTHGISGRRSAWLTVSGFLTIALVLVLSIGRRML